MKFKTILILVAVVLGVASGCETVCTDKQVDGKWVSSSCTSNGGEILSPEDGFGTSTLELRGRELVQPINRFPYAIPEDESTYVVMHGTTTETRIMVERIGARVEAIVPCGNDDETCSDLAEALNQARRRRVK